MMSGENVIEGGSVGGVEESEMRGKHDHLESKKS